MSAPPPPVPTALLNVAFLLLLTALALAFTRFVRGPTTADRVVAFDLMAAIVTGSVATASVAYDSPALLDAAIVIALVAFLATVAFAHHVREERAPP